MPTYLVTLSAKGSSRFRVEADDPVEARDIAQDALEEGEWQPIKEDITYEIVDVEEEEE